MNDVVALRRTLRRHQIVVARMEGAAPPTPLTQRDYSEEIAAIERAIDRLLIEDVTLRHQEGTR